MFSIITFIRSLYHDTLLSRFPLHKFCSILYLQRYVHKQPDFQPLYRKILIANRGEIACRIIKTCREMGIKTVSIFSSIDSQSLHVRLADESWFIGSHSGYLDMHAILNAALSTHSQAIHPGYGFLSENYKFVELLEDNNIIFIGPGSKAIKSMGDKIQSKKIARNANVNTIPGYLGIISDESHALEIANEIGYPIMIKASAGGGGKGMRITDNQQQVKFLIDLYSHRRRIGGASPLHDLAMGGRPLQKSYPAPPMKLFVLLPQYYVLILFEKHNTA